ncbi:hypothetical protein I2485_06930 [Nesterenkonia sp. E16_7]|uniref:hypothetical protein n=1 Tax=unclassified Nesterenkonia TaxID=2629769 RepID=UPI001A917BCB|nr:MULTISPECIES: hypothetical protein [unclassified Nesterenkonia]MBO0596609.1 hypothetical protein [Nesterenkonia sp. E16_10]MBO0598385.1 hypothetical protein [Nesterenkonia sp. E16_7]
MSKMLRNPRGVQVDNREINPVPRSSTHFVRLTALMLAVGLITACSDARSEPVNNGDSGGGTQQQGDQAQQECGDQAMVDWNEGLIQKEQVAEIEYVVSVMREHFGDEVVRLDGGEWDMERFLNWPGIPYPSHRDPDHYYYEVEFDFSTVEANQDTQEKALAVLEEIGLSPNGEQPTAYDPDRRTPLDVTGGADDGGRIFRIEQLNPEAEIAASFSTRHSDHSSMHEAHEANWED